MASGGGGGGGGGAARTVDDCEKDVLFVQMALDDARSKGNDAHVVPALIKLGLLHFTMAGLHQQEKQRQAQAANEAAAAKAERESVKCFNDSEKFLQEAVFEGKRLKQPLDGEQLVLVYERMGAIADKQGKYEDMEKHLRALLGELERKAKTKFGPQAGKAGAQAEQQMRRAKAGLSFALLKLKNWEPLHALLLELLRADADYWTSASVSGEDRRAREREAVRLFRYLADCVNNLPPSDEVDRQLRAFNEAPHFAKLEGFKSVILRAMCTSLNKRKKHKELCCIAAEYAEELRASLEKEREKGRGKPAGQGRGGGAVEQLVKQCADMHRLSAIAYNALGEHAKGKRQAELGRGVLYPPQGGLVAAAHTLTLHLCCKEEIKALNCLEDWPGMLQVMQVAEGNFGNLPADLREGRETVSFYTNFGFVLQQVKRHEEALPKYERAANLSKELGTMDEKTFNVVLTCGSIALNKAKGRENWGVVLLDRFMGAMKATHEALACKALVLRAQLLVKGKKFQDAIDSLEESWEMCNNPKADRNPGEEAAARGKNARMGLVTASELACIYQTLVNMRQYITWKEMEIALSAEVDTPQDTAETKIAFINALMEDGSTEYKEKLQMHFREASEIVKRHELKECAEKLSKLYVNLLACEDLIDTDFSDKILGTGLSAVSKFNVALTEVKTHIGRGRVQEAEDGIGKLQELVSEGTDEVELLLIQATLATKKGELEGAGTQLDKAITKAGEAVERVEKDKDKEGGGKASREDVLKLKASALKLSGGNLNIRGQYDRSLKRLQESMMIYIELNDKEGELGALSSIGYVYLDLKEDSRAESAFQQTLEFAETSGNETFLSNSLLDLGNLYINTRNIAKAQECVERALEIAQRLDLEYNVARAYAALCNIEFSKKNYKLAVAHANKAKALLDKAEDAVFASRLLANLGNIYEKLGNKSGGQSSLAFHKKNVEVAKESGDNVLYCISLLALGDIVSKNISALLEKESEDASGNHIYVTKAMLNEGRGYYNDCLAVAKKNHDLSSEGNALRGLASSKRLEVSSRVHQRGKADLRKATGRRRNFLRAFSSRRAAGSMQRELNDASLDYLLWAAKTGDLERITDLVKLQKVDADISDDNQYTALHLAAQEGHLPVVKYLIEDAKANAQCETVQFDTPYALALSRGRKEVSDYLKDIAGVLPFVKANVMKEVEERRTTGDTGDYKEFSEYVLPLLPLVPPSMPMSVDLPSLSSLPSLSLSRASVENALLGRYAKTPHPTLFSFSECS